METRNSFLKVLGKIDILVHIVKKELEKVKSNYINLGITAAYEQALTLEERTEKLVLLTRVLPAYTGNPGAKADVENIIMDTIPIEIGFTEEGWFGLKIPALLPKKSEGSPEYIRSFLYPAMERYFKNRNPLRIKDCVLIYRHVYEKSRPERARRDHDNIEINMVSDIVAIYVLPDDSPGICSHYYCSAGGSEDRTEIYVVPKNQFSIWLITEKSIPDEGVKLYEEMPK